MRVCPKCNTTNRDEAKFCNSCGTRLEVAPATHVEPAAEPVLVPVEAPEKVPGPLEQAQAAPAPMAAPAPAAVEAARCSACGYTVHHCPSCGAPMQRVSGAHSQQGG